MGLGSPFVAAEVIKVKKFDFISKACLYEAG